MTSIVMDRYRYVPPTAADFPTIVGTNSENPTLTDTTGRGLNIAFGTSPAGSGENLRGCFKALNAASSQTIIARFEWMALGWNYTVAGLAFYDGTKFGTWGRSWRGVPGYAVDTWTTNVLNNSEPYFSGQNQTSGNYSSYGDMEWMRVDLVSGSPTKFFVGPNGTDWIELYTGALSSFFTPTKVGFFMDCNMSGNGNKPVAGTETMYLNVLYYKDPDIVPSV